MLDDIDKSILKIIHKNARASYTEIGEAVGLSRVAVKTRMDKMEKSGVIQGYTARIVSYERPDGVEFFVNLKVEQEHEKKAIETLVANKFFQKVSSTVGRYNIYAEGIVPDDKAYIELVAALKNGLEGLESIMAGIVVSVHKDVDGGIDYDTESDEHEHLETEGRA